MFTEEQAVINMVASYKPKRILLFKGKGKALIEFYDVKSCESAIAYLNQRANASCFKSSTGNIKQGLGLIVDPNGQVIPSSTLIKKNSKMVKLVIKCSVYPVTVSNVYHACAQFGQPIKIATFVSPDAVNALVEFTTEEEAEKVVVGLDQKFFWEGSVGLIKASFSTQQFIIIKEGSQHHWTAESGQSCATTSGT